MEDATSTTRVRARPCRLLMLTALLTSGLACDPGDPREEETDATESAVDKRVVHALPTVEAGGAGCPPGSVRIARSKQGMRVTLSFDDYVTAVNENIPLVRKECFVSIGIPESDPRAYAVTSVTASAEASLKQGAYALWTSVASVEGSHPRSGSDRVNSRQVDGPHQGRVEIGDPPEAPRFSACGVRPDIQLTTLSTVQNAAPFQANSFRVKQLVVQLATRSCP